MRSAGLESSQLRNSSVIETGREGEEREHTCLTFRSARFIFFSEDFSKDLFRFLFSRRHRRRRSVKKNREKKRKEKREGANVNQEYSVFEGGKSTIQSKIYLHRKPERRRRQRKIAVEECEQFRLPAYKIRILIVPSVAWCSSIRDSEYIYIHRLHLFLADGNKW